MRSFFALNRLLYIGITLAGLAALAVSLKSGWFGVPTAPAGGAYSVDQVVKLEPNCTRWAKAVMGVGAVLIVASWCWRRQWTMASTVMASLLCVVPLSYPYFVMVRSPVVSAEAAWLQMQHDNLLWLGGDVYSNAEFAQRGGKAKAYLIDVPRQLSVIKLPSWSPWEIGLDRCQDLVIWLGYSNAFCQFVGRGWAMAILGAVMLLLASLQRQGEFVFSRAGVAIAIFTGTSVLAAVVGWSLPFRASGHVRAAAQRCSERDFQGSREELDRAVALLPVLAQDTHYVAQRGVLDSRLGIDSDFARLRTAIRLESQARYDQAYLRLEPLIRSPEPAIRREALRGVQRFAIQDYNSTRFGLSADRFRLVLRHQPCNVKLIYLLQLQAIRESRPSDVRTMRDWMYGASDHLRFGTKKILRAASQQHVVIAAGLVEDPMETWAAQRKAKRP